MKVWNEQMYPDNEKVYFTAYIQENLPEIDPERKRPLITNTAHISILATDLLEKYLLQTKPRS